MPDRFSSSREDSFSRFVNGARSGVRRTMDQIKPITESLSRDMKDITGGRSVDDIDNLQGRTKAFLDNKPFYRLVSEYEKQQGKPLKMDSDGFPKEFRQLYAKRIGGLSEGEINPSPDFTNWYTKHWQGTSRQGDVDVLNERNAISNVPDEKVNFIGKGLRYLNSVPLHGNSRYRVGIPLEVLKNKNAWNIPDADTRGFRRLIIERARNLEGVIKPEYIPHGSPVYDVEKGMTSVGTISKPDIEEKLKTPGFVRQQKDYLGGLVGDAFNTLSRVQQGWSSGASIGGGTAGPLGALVGGLIGAGAGTGVSLAENIRGATDASSGYNGKRHIPYLSNAYDIGTLVASGAGLIKGKFFNRGSKIPEYKGSQRSNTPASEPDVQPIEISSKKNIKVRENPHPAVPGWVDESQNKSVININSGQQGITPAQTRLVLNNNYQNRFGRLGNYAQMSADRNQQQLGRNLFYNSLISGYNIADSRGGEDVIKKVKNIVSGSGKTAKKGFQYLTDLYERSRGREQ